MAIPTPQQTIINPDSDSALLKTSIALATANGGVYILNTTKDIYVTAVEETYSQQFVTNQTITNNPGNVVDGVQFNSNGTFASDAQFTYDPNTDTLTLENLLIANGIANLGPVANIKISGGSNGQVLTTYGNGTLSFSNPTLSNLVNGNSNISIAANANITFGVTGNASVFTVDANSVTVKSTNGNLVLGRATATGSPGLSSTTSLTLTANRGGSPENSWVFGTDGNLTLPSNVSNVSVGSAGNLSLTSNAHSWLFDIAGTLSLPQNTDVGAAVIQPNDTNFGLELIVNGSTWTYGTDSNIAMPGSINFPNASINVATANFIGLYPTATITDQTYLELQEGASGYAALTANANVYLTAGKSASTGANWIFATTGNTTIPSHLKSSNNTFIIESGTGAHMDFGVNMSFTPNVSAPGVVYYMLGNGTFQSQHAMTIQSAVANLTMQIAGVNASNLVVKNDGVYVANVLDVTGVANLRSNITVAGTANLQGRTTIGNLQATVTANTTATLGNLVTITINGTSYELFAK